MIEIFVAFQLLFSAAPDSKIGVFCLAKNIYFESRNENTAAAKYAVADVVLNRVSSKKYPNTICGVVEQSNSRGCQFSWVCENPDYPKNSEEWNKSLYIAVSMLYGDVYRGISDGSTHYHADYVKPYWSTKLQPKGKFGFHMFYRE